MPSGDPLAGPVVRLRPPDLVSAEVRRLTGKAIVYVRQRHAGIDCDRAGLKLKIKIGRLINEPRITGIGRRYLPEDVVIDENAVPILSRSFAEFLQGFEFPVLFRPDLLLHALLWRR